ncbi:MAG: metal-dependent hydrolase [Methanocorpusculum sp.]|nr:metal-dependent hydrolase [Methanocorpusculum sp.]
MKITYAGHSCFILEGSKKILIDPMPVNPQEIKADLTLITHAHSDHIGDSPEKLGLCAAIHELSGYLSGLGVKTIGMNIGGSFDFGDVKITMVKAEHSSSMNQNGLPVYMGEPCGFVVKMDGLTVYHAGDTGLFSDMKLIRKLYKPDVAILPAGGLFTMGPDECMTAAEYLGAGIVIPMHYNTFEAIKQDLTDFKKSVELTTSSRVELMKPGETLTI